jgi:hypothetical protein
VYLDYLMHHMVNLSLGFALGFGLAIRSGQLLWSFAGFAVATGWGLLSLHNDCRYKAFFQRLKSVSCGYRVVGGSGERPGPPSSWPKRGLGFLSWPALKLCEPHIVLFWLSALAIMALLVPSLWIVSWQIVTASMALLAPMLAGGRITRAVTRGKVEAEFDRWFNPLKATSGSDPGPCTVLQLSQRSATHPASHSDHRCKLDIPSGRV